MIAEAAATATARSARLHVVFTLPSAIGDIAYQNKAVVYDLLLKASSEAMLRRSHTLAPATAAT